MAKKRKPRKKKVPKVINPHDAFFKGMFSRQEIVETYLARFVRQDLVERLDLKSLSLLPTSYVTDDLEEFCADLVWKANYYTGGTVEVALLFEHKSYIPEYAELQLLRYWLEGTIAQIKNKEKLRVIIPILIYHGDGEWKARQISDYFDGIDSLLKRFVPSFDYCVTNVSSYSNNELISMELGKLLNVFLVLIHIRDANYILQNFKTLFIFAEHYLPDKGDFLQTIFVYLFRNVELNEQHWEQVLNTFDTPLKKFSMSAYDMLIEKGEKRGFERGIAQGVAQGVAQGDQQGFERGVPEGEVKNAKKVIHSLLLEFPDMSDAKIAQLANATIELVKEIRLSK